MALKSIANRSAGQQWNEPAVTAEALVVFGASGDLAQRMLWPSLYHLIRDGLMSPATRIVGATRQFSDDAGLRHWVAESLGRHLAPGDLQAEAVQRLLQAVSHARVEVTDAGISGVEQMQQALAGCQRVMYFLSTAHTLYTPICAALAAAGLINNASRVVLEKPIGNDRASSELINEAFAQHFREEQVLRIDHYLGKETVQNLLALRFANALFEPMWSSVAIEHVQITVAETVGIEGRWSYYDHSGALRDMVQNHMLQLLALVAMEPPATFDAAAVRSEKTKVLRSLRPITGAAVETHSVRGQYAAGNINGKVVPGYTGETGADTNSNCETFVALRAKIDNWRWAGVPFYLRTGKRLQSRRSDIVIQFRKVPHNIFSAHQATLPANRLIIRLQPQESVTLELLGKQPGLDGIRLAQVPLELSLRDAFGVSRSRLAYERLLLDALHGNSTLFVRRDEISAAWEWIDGIHEGWARCGFAPKPYPAGSWGPTAAIALAERHAHSWYE
jgi:glucose-6-phosphate 1-dehydrogenase